MSKRFLIIIIVIALALVGLMIFIRRDKANAPQSSTSSQGSNHVQGQGTEGVTLLEYGDFQCPGCGLAYPILKEVKQKYGDKIKFQFRHYPLPQIHPNAVAAHRAAEAAGLQNKFWEMHDALYERQNSWATSNNPARIFEDYAAELGLNIEKFKTDVASSAVNRTVNADIKLGQDLPVSATPTLVLNGKKLDQTPQTLEDFSKIIDQAIAAKSSR